MQNLTFFFSFHHLFIQLHLCMTCSLMLQVAFNQLSMSIHEAFWTLIFSPTIPQYMHTHAERQRERERRNKISSVLNSQDILSFHMASHSLFLLMMCYYYSVCAMYQAPHYIFYKHHLT